MEGAVVGPDKVSPVGRNSGAQVGSAGHSSAPDPAGAGSPQQSLGEKKGNCRGRPSTTLHRRPAQTRAPMIRQPGRVRAAPVLGYASEYAARSEQGISDLRRQEEEIAYECGRRGLRLLRVVHERDAPHRRPLERPGLGYALGQIAAGEASGLVVSELFRVTHSVPELGGVLEWLVRHDARFVAAASGVDTAEEAGRLTVQTIIQLSRWERQRLVERTRNGMRAARRKGPASVSDYPELTERIAGMRAGGMTLQAIADQLNAEEVPTVRGGARWRPSSVQAAAGYHRKPATEAGLRQPETNSPTSGVEEI
jgi:DNA invertase Pin-like site-specific DNA recombinase